jgi:digeranylgeranylglycerophospholipid reductase
MIASLQRNVSRSAAGVQDLPVSVVGGSAAGLFAAYLLARGGAPVQVLERSERLEPAERTLIVTHRMKKLLGNFADGCVTNEIREFELFTDGRAASISLGRPDLVIERATLIRSLAEQARAAGAKLLFGRRFRSLHAHENGLALELERTEDGGSEEVHARTVVGSDGAASKVAESAGWRRQETVPLIQAIVPLPPDMRCDTVRVWFVPQDTPYFYWLIPESPTRGVLGLIGEAGQETRRHLERFLEKRKLEPLAYQGAKIPVYSGWVPVERRLAGGRVYLIGDAAGQVKVTTVGGIVTGFRGAQGVAEAILNGRTSRELRSLRWELNLHLLLRRAIHNFAQGDYSLLVDLLNQPARKSLAEHSRDEALKVLFHICVSQPRLLLLGLRGLLTRGRLLGKPRS